MKIEPTIFALSSGADRAGVAVIRVSGPGARTALMRLSRVSAEKLRPRMAVRARLVEPVSGRPLDDALAIWFPAPASFTGEDVVELHVHGGPAVIRGVLSALGTLPGFRLAEPGEFARRAFENGKLDLTEAEAIADLIDAETEAQRAQALGQLGGRLRAAAEAWRDRMLEAQALVEAAIDFSDEGDVSQDAVARADFLARALSSEIGAALDDANRGEIVRDGLRVALIGPPNAGKSSLLNRLAGREAAIVSDEAGTTRDVVEVAIDLGGYLVRVFDTAGLRETEGKVEQEGIRRALARAEDSHLVLLLSAPDVDGFDGKFWRGAVTEQIRAAEREGRLVRVANKSDLGAALLGDQLSAIHGRTGAQTLNSSEPLAISCRTGAGLEQVSAVLTARAADRLGRVDGHAPLITQARHREHLSAARAGLQQFSGTLKAGAGLELAAEDLRGAAQQLGRITGAVDAEAVLGAIFGRFCIGK